MFRTELIQSVIDKKQASRYLEIGVASGTSFFPLRVKKKIAVDPKFHFGVGRKIRWSFKNYLNLNARYFEMTSDAYFDHHAQHGPFDVIFIDGLHTYEQTLKDVDNALKHLSPTGVIVMHDCSPPHAAAAQHADSPQQAESMKLAGWNDLWCGDVWKTICHLRSQRKDLNIFVLDCDFGLGVVTRGKPESMLDFTDEQIAKLTYADLEKDRARILNLKNEKYAEEFLNRLN